MKLVVVAVGRLKNGPERDLVARYSKRCEKLGRTLGLSGLETVEIPESRARREDDRRADEAAAILRATGPHPFFAFDERGLTPDSTAFADLLSRRMDAGAPALAAVIGGPDGLDPIVTAQASAIVAFGALTVPHQLVRVLVVEQLYRAFTILAGHPYHRVGDRDR